MSEFSAIDLIPVPRLDHVMVLLDGPAHRDAATSDFLRDRFGRVRQKTADSSVAGRYATLGVAGDSTLVELFGAELPASAPLTGGLVFSFEEPGSSPAARAALDRSGRVRHHHDLVRRAVPGSVERQPWYHLISVDLGEGSPLLLFLNEVCPDYFESVGARRAPGGAMRRRDYLDAVLGPPAPRLMRDVIGVTLAVRPERARRIADAMAAFGWAETGPADDLALHGPDLTVRLRAGEQAVERVAEIELQLVPDPVGFPAEFALGTTSRVVRGAGDTARWIFDPMGG